MKNLRLKNINVGNCLTARELRDYEILKGNLPVVLKCGGKNYKLNDWKIVNDRLVLVGVR